MVDHGHWARLRGGPLRPSGQCLSNPPFARTYQSQDARPATLAPKTTGSLSASNERHTDDVDLG